MNSNHKHSSQIKRIKTKLKKAREFDKDKQVFGADSHDYVISQTISHQTITDFENKHGIKLPSDYIAFLCEVGNGGTSYQNSAAGPFYGIYPFGQGIDELAGEKAVSLNTVPNVFPKMSDDYWEQLTQKVNQDDNISDNEYYEEMQKIFSGILVIGSQGCTNYHGILLSGEYVGRIINIDIELISKPNFAYENNFLDWYERWLDEVNNGVLVENSPSWFGYVMGGNENTLLKAYSNANDDEDRLAALSGLSILKQIQPSSCDELVHIIESENSTAIKHKALNMLTKFNHEMAIPYLKEFINSTDADCLAAFQSIFWHSKFNAHMWADEVKERVPSIENFETYQLATYVLGETSVDYSRDILNLCTHPNDDFRKHSLYILGKFPFRPEFVDYFVNGLNDTSPYIVHITLQAISDIKDVRLLKPYFEITDRFQTDENYILTNLNHRVKDLGFRNLEAFKASYIAGNAQKRIERQHSESNWIRRVFKRFLG